MKILMNILEVVFVAFSYIIWAIFLPFQIISNAMHKKEKEKEAEKYSQYMQNDLYYSMKYMPYDYYLDRLSHHVSKLIKISEK